MKTSKIYKRRCYNYFLAHLIWVWLWFIYVKMPMNPVKYNSTWASIYKPFNFAYLTSINHCLCPWHMKQKLVSELNQHFVTFIITTSLSIWINLVLSLLQSTSCMPARKSHLCRANENADYYSCRHRIVDVEATPEIPIMFMHFLCEIYVCVVPSLRTQNLIYLHIKFISI